MKEKSALKQNKVSGEAVPRRLLSQGRLVQAMVAVFQVHALARILSL